MINKHVGIAVSQDNPEAIVQAILDLKNNKEKCINLGKRGYDYGRKLYSRSNNMKTYIELIKKCSGSPK